MKKLSAIALVLAATLTIAAPAAAQGPDASGASCAYVSAGAPGPADNRLQVAQTGGQIGLARSGQQVLVSHGGQALACDGPAPTVRNIDAIEVRSDTRWSLLLDLRGGPLAPGATESGPAADIEVVVAPSRDGFDLPGRFEVLSGGGDNRLHVGQSGTGPVLNLNPLRERSDDADVFAAEVGTQQFRTIVRPGAGDDVVSGRGWGIYEATRKPMSVYAGAGRDRILATSLAAINHLWGGYGSDAVFGGDRSDRITGGPGNDRLRGGRGNDSLHPRGGADFVSAGLGNDWVNSSDQRRDRVVCGAGDDSVRPDRRDVLRGCENVR